MGHQFPTTPDVPGSAISCDFLVIRPDSGERTIFSANQRNQMQVRIFPFWLPAFNLRFGTAKSSNIAAISPIHSWLINW